MPCLVLLVLFLGLYAGLPHRLFAQAVEETSYVQRIWTTEDGLPQNSVTALARTQDGYLWVGTLQGLARFDGTRFTTFEASTTSGLEGDRIFSLLEDQSGTLWINTESGQLSSYQAGHFTSHLDLGAVLSLYEDRQGMLWFGTTDGLLRRDGSRFTRFTTDDGLPGNQARILLEDRAGTLWIRTDGGLALRHNDGFIAPASSFEGPISTLAEQADGTLWLNTGHGIRRVVNQQVTDYPLPEVVVRRVVVDRSDRVWVLTNGQGLLRFTGDGFTPFNDPEQRIGTVVHTLLEDDQGLLWIGTRSSGLYQIQERLFSAYTQDDGLPADIIHGVLEDRTGAIWVGTFNSGLARLTGDRQVTTYAVQDGLPGTDIRVLTEDEEGHIWATTPGMNLVRFNGTRFVVPPPASGLAEEAGRGLAVSGGPSGALWQITESGVYLRQHGTITHVLDQPFQTMPEPMLEDRAGRLWLRLNDRLCRVEREHLFCFAGLDPAPLVRTVHEVADDTFWLGTYGVGLCQLRHAQLTCLSKAHGLPDGTVHRILEDDFGYVWLSSNKGIARIARQDLIAFFDGEIDRIYPDVYGTAGGMPSNECNGGVYPAGWKARDGRLWFPTMKGLAVVDPAQALQQTPLPPLVQIEALTNDGVPVSFEEPMTLPAGSDRLVFHYTAPFLRAPEKLRFRYRLEGHDATWIEAGTARTATYTNLPPGTYHFMVQTAIGSSPWQEATRLPFRMAPFFYQTAWFAGLAAMGMLLLLVMAYQARMRRVLERERLYRSEEEAHRLAELDAAKSRFIANISHEFRTPLTVILGATDQLKHRETAPQPIGAIRRNAHRLLQLVNQLLDLSKLETGKLHLAPQPGDLVAFLRHLVRSMQPLAERRSIDLRLRTEVEQMGMLFDSDVLEKVFNNVLSNALKFTPEGGKVWVTMERRTIDDEQVAEVIFKDTGPGIPPTALPSIFDRFSQVNGSATREHEGTGIGLALAKELVELHGGKILIESEVGFGSAFLVRLPFVATERKVMKQGERSDRSVADYQWPMDAGKEEVGLVEPNVQNQKLKILLVEDHVEVRALVRSYLEETYHIIEATDGEAGLHAARQQEPDLILSDVMMPRMDGYALCQAIKSDEKLRHIPVVLLTAKAAEEDKIVGLQTGADAYIAKPFPAAVLRAQIASLIASRHQLRAQFSQELVIQPAGVVVPSEEEAFLQHVLAAIEARLGDTTFGVEALAEAVGLSRRHLTRRIRRLTDQSPAALIRQMRLERAAHLLEAQSGTVAEIAFAVGFTSPSYFATAFRQAFGHPPSVHFDSGP